MRRWLIIGIIFFFLFIFGAVIYVFFLGGDDLLQAPEDQNNSQNTTSVSPGSNQTLYNLTAAQTNTGIVSAVFSLDDSAVWYFTADGRLFREGLDGGQAQEFALPKILQVEQVFWSKGSDFIVRHKAGEGLLFAYYNALSKQYIDLPANVLSLGWIPAIGKIIYVWRNDNGSIELSIADPDATDFSTLHTLPEELTVLTSSSGSRVLLYKPYTDAPNQAYLFDTNSGQLRLLIDRGRNTSFHFSPDGSKLIFSRINDSTGLPELWLYEFGTDTFTNLMINTGASNVGFIRSQPDRLLLATEDTANGVEENISETLYSYDFVSGISTVLSSSAAAVDYKDIKTSLDGSTVIFIDANTDSLYRLRLR